MYYYYLYVLSSKNESIILLKRGNMDNELDNMLKYEGSTHVLGLFFYFNYYPLVLEGCVSNSITSQLKYFLLLKLRNCSKIWNYFYSFPIKYAWEKYVFVVREIEHFFCTGLWNLSGLYHFENDKYTKTMAFHSCCRNTFKWVFVEQKFEKNRFLCFPFS